MATLDQILTKLDRPPAAHNFARCNFPTLARTTSSLVNLAMGFPIVSYQWANRIIALTIVDQRTDEQATAMLASICPVSQLEANLELLNAFLVYNAVRRFEGFEVFPEFAGWFEAGPNVAVPVRPTVIIRENGRLIPLTIVGWTSNPFTYFQYRFFSFMLEDAIYSLTDFQDSPGEVLFFPKSRLGERTVVRLNRGDYLPLAREEVISQVERFVKARHAARPMIADRFAERQFRKAAEASARAGKKETPRKGSSS